MLDKSKKKKKEERKFLVYFYLANLLQTSDLTYNFMQIVHIV